MKHEMLGIVMGYFRDASNMLIVGWEEVPNRSGSLGTNEIPLRLNQAGGVTIL